MIRGDPRAAHIVLLKFDHVVNYLYFAQQYPLATLGDIVLLIIGASVVEKMFYLRCVSYIVAKRGYR